MTSVKAAVASLEFDRCLPQLPAIAPGLGSEYAFLGEQPQLDLVLQLIDCHLELFVPSRASVPKISALELAGDRANFPKRVVVSVVGSIISVA